MTDTEQKYFQKWCNKCIESMKQPKLAKLLSIQRFTQIKHNEFIHWPWL